MATALESIQKVHKGLPMVENVLESLGEMIQLEGDPGYVRTALGGLAETLQDMAGDLTAASRQV